MGKYLGLYLQLLVEANPEHVLLTLGRQQNVPEAVILVMHSHVLHGVEGLLVIERRMLLHDGRDFLGVAQAPHAHELKISPEPPTKSP